MQTMNIEEKTKKWCSDNIASIIYNLQQQFKEKQIDRMRIVELIGKYLYYHHYGSPQWQAHKKYLIYQYGPFYFQKQQYLNVLIANDITKDKKKINEVQKYFQDQLMSYAKQQQKNQKQKNNQMTVGLILHPENREDYFLMIEINQSANYQFQHYLNQKPCELLKKLQILYQISEKNKKKLQQVFEKLYLKTFLKQYQDKHNTFQLELNKFKEYYLKYKNVHNLTQNDIYKKYLQQDKDYQKKKKLSSRLKQQQIPSDIQKAFNKLFKFLFSQFQNSFYKSPIKKYGFAKGGQAWFEAIEDTCRRQVFQETKVNLFNYKLQIPFYFKTIYHGKTQYFTFYYADKNLDHIQKSYYQQIFAYDVITAQSKQHVFSKSLTQIAKNFHQKQYGEWLCLEYLQSILAKDLTVNDNAKKAIYQLLKLKMKVNIKWKRMEVNGGQWKMQERLNKQTQ